MPDKSTVQSIERGLRVLEFLNENNGATIAQITHETGLTAGTVYRLLSSLRDLGYLRKDPDSPGYWLASRVRSLSDGFRDEWWIEAHARDIVEKLGEQLRWPVKLLTPAGVDMLTRVTTDYRSPYAQVKVPAGLRFDMLSTASGLCYLALCDRDQRRVLLKLLTESWGERVKRPKTHTPGSRSLNMMLSGIRADGYFAYVHGGSRTLYAIAVPIVASEHPIGAIETHVFRAVVPGKSAAQAIAVKLQAAAAEIGHRLITR